MRQGPPQYHGHVEELRLEGERRHVTVLFADLVGFTAYSERAGEEAAYGLMQRLAKLLRNEIEVRGGSVRGFTGDGAGTGRTCIRGRSIDAPWKNRLDPTPHRVHPGRI